tara:strand:- start:19010 stop:19849 length:840 start_codon:yes stop_codon:yes gene_type:complete
LKLITDTAEEIVRRSGSNLAFALAVLPARKRRDMGIFYAFCRVVDDLADDLDHSTNDRKEGLERWRKLIYGEIEQPLRGVETEFVELCHRRALPVDDLEAIVTGVEMDLDPQEFQTHEDLKHYCYHVASAVGLVSIEIFGYEDPATKDYAEQLGYALQWTNILRDVGEDSREGRVFLPKDVMEQFGLTTESVLSGNPDRAAFLRLMEDQTFVARRFYESARRALPDQDRKSMRSAELMRRIYSAILDRMEADGYHVFEKRYRLSKARMIMEFLHAKFVG